MSLFVCPYAFLRAEYRPQTRKVIKQSFYIDHIIGMYGTHIEKWIDHAPLRGRYTRMCYLSHKCIKKQILRSANHV